jgi:hypothetical protein
VTDARSPDRAHPADLPKGWVPVSVALAPTALIGHVAITRHGLGTQILLRHLHQAGIRFGVADARAADDGALPTPEVVPSTAGR